MPAPQEPEVPVPQRRQDRNRRATGLTSPRARHMSPHSRVGGRQRRDEQIHARRSLPGLRREGGRSAGTLLEVVDRDADDAAEPIDAAVHGLVHTTRVLEERCPGHRRTSARARGRTARRSTGRHGAALLEASPPPLRTAEPQLAPADELAEVFFLLVAPRQPSSMTSRHRRSASSVAHPPHDVGEPFLGPHRAGVQSQARS